ncbi:unnamed protein product [Effrenium voratum]|uniref:DOT1 domain-containing protein n=1 Tax=Effrenium voratum TaxID=2562239 RepID=A0AA36JRY7_9DINO|nr:unnamed protein product [Effrenium voratum]
MGPKRELRACDSLLAAHLARLVSEAWASCHKFPLIEVWRGLRENCPWAQKGAENSVAAYRFGPGHAAAAAAEVWPLFDPGGWQKNGGLGRWCCEWNGVCGVHWFGLSGHQCVVHETHERGILRRNCVQAGDFEPAVWHGFSIEVSPATPISELKAAAQQHFKRRLKLIANGQQLDLTGTVTEARLRDGDVVVAIAQLGKLATNERVFALNGSDGEVVTWGDPDSGGDSSQVQEQLTNTQHIQATDLAFAAILEVVTWGDPDSGGDSSKVQEQLRNVWHIQATSCAFAAILESGSVVTWDDPDSCGDSSKVQEQLRNVWHIQATSCAFAAILESGSVVTWDDPDSCGDSSKVQEQLRNVWHIQATSCAFAAILESGSVVTWDDPDSCGDSSKVQEQLRNVRHIQATLRAFAAILESRAVVTWGYVDFGGGSRQVQEQLTNVLQIQATVRAFAAILESGAVVTWGDPGWGGDSSQVQEQLRNVLLIQATSCAFAAILESGAVVTWGDPEYGGDSSQVQRHCRSLAEALDQPRPHVQLQGALQEGNVQVEAFAYLLDRVCRRGVGDIFRRFVDLGSGRGLAVLIAHALFPFRDCVGVEICKEFNDSARSLAKRYADTGLAKFSKAKKKLDPTSMFVEGDLRDFDWSDASVAFANCVTWPVTLVAAMARKALRLRVGAVLLTSKRFPNDVMRGFDFRGEACMGDWTPYAVELWAYQRI